MSASIMSTSENTAGLPDLETLSKLANQFFAGSAPGKIPAHGGVATPSTPLPDIILPHQVEAQASIPAAQSLPATPQIARDASVAQFYFLEHAKRFDSGIAVPGHIQDSAVASRPPAPAGLDANLLRQDFPILQERVNGRQLVWLDNAATTQKPRQVIERIKYFYEHENSNIHRAAHELAARATDAYEAAREKVRAFLNARSTNEIVFVRGATEAINLVAKSWGYQNIGAGDEIIITWLEHHANIVPWQQLCQEKGARLRVIPVDDDGQVILEEYAQLLSPRTKLVSVTQVSNALGTVVPVKQIADLARAATLANEVRAKDAHGALT